VLFSFSRTRFRNPLPELVEGLRESAPTARMACTQLSAHCASNGQNLLQIRRPHMLNRPANGATAGTCCAGTFTISVSDDGVAVQPDGSSHQQFIESISSTPLCAAASQPA
jgi:competence protein ComEC